MIEPVEIPQGVVVVASVGVVVVVVSVGVVSVGVVGVVSGGPSETWMTITVP